VDGTSQLFSLNDAAAARSQLPGRPGFEGWIAFNRAMSSTPEQVFRDAVQEIGYLFGLPHNPWTDIKIPHMGGAARRRARDGFR
jgi:hypothetical protein